MKIKKMASMMNLFQMLLSSVVLGEVMMLRQDITNRGVNVASTPASWVLGLNIMLISMLAVIGVVIGSILWIKVESRHMLIGSAIYWTFALLYLYVNRIAVGLTVAISLSTFMVLSSNITFIIIYLVRRRRLKRPTENN